MMKISINLLRAAMLSIVAVTVFAAMPHGKGDGSPANLDDELCQPPLPVETQVSPGAPPQLLVQATVPSTTPDFGKESSNVYHASKGDVIGVNVSTPRPGSIAVHGLMDTKKATVGAMTSGSFRAIYTGRFPLHFHGADGSHFEIAVVEVAPESRP